MTLRANKSSKLGLLAVAVLLTGCKDLDIETDGNKDEFRFGSPVHLWCTFKDKVVPNDGATARWTSDRQGEIGTTADITVSNLAAGRHKIEVEVRHGDKKGKKTRRIEILNDAPVLTIGSPTRGQRIGVGQVVRFVGSGADREDGAVPVQTLFWSSNLQGQLGTGATVEVTHLQPGVHEITLKAVDKAGAQGTTRVSIEITNEAPVVSISEPSSSVTIKVSQRLRLRGSAQDRDHRLGPERVLPASLEWHSSKDGKLGTGEDISVDTLSAGTHEIELRAKDEYGKVGTKTVRVSVQNDPPSVDIKEPTDGRYFSAADEVRFDVEARDAEAPLDDQDIVWRSNKDGTIGRGYSVRTNRLSVGEHRVTCTVTDKHGASASDTVRVLITNNAPTARIVGPSAGVVHLTDDLQLEGRGTDTEDGALDGDRLAWTAVRVDTGRTLDLGTGSRRTQSVRRLVDALGFGRVELRLVATDRDGTASPAVSVAITIENRVPDVRIANPTDNAVVAVGAMLLCSGYGQDPDRNRLLENAEMVWTSRRLEDGSTRELGRATRLEVRDLIAGTYELTLTAIDPDDQNLKASAKVRVRVEAAVTTSTTPPTSTTTTASTTTSTGGTGGIVGAIPGQ